MRLNRLRQSILFSFFLCSGSVHGAEIRTLVVDFGGDKQLGRSVATILDLQLWRTLRAASEGQTETPDFGTGTVYRLGQGLDEPGHGAAVLMAQKLDINAQVVLWGDVFPIGKTALVTAYLTLADYFDFRKTKNELWSLTISHADKHSKITADVPQRHYEFEPLSLPIDFVERYSTPSAIPIMKSQDGGKRLGYLGTVYRHCGSNGEYACVASEGNKGWVYLPQLGEQKPEIVDFIGGIVRVYRSDWQGAIDLLRSVIANPVAPVNLKIDSYLYIIRAKSELGLAADGEIESVMAVTFPSRSVIQYAAMHLIQRCLAELEPGRKKAECLGTDRRRLADLVLKKKAVFAVNDPWLLTVKQLLDGR